MLPKPADMLVPAGLLAPSHFPGEGPEVINTRLTGYINDGAKRAPDVAAERQFDAVIAWAYHLAFLAVYVRLTTSPAQADVEDQASYQYLVTQINNVKALADEWHGKFLELTTTAEAPDLRASGTRSTAAEFVF